jgi:hypothetical protein
VQSFYALLALDLAAEKSRQIDEEVRSRMLLEDLPERSSFVRRALARGTAAISLGAAAATRRLDECIADDLGRSLALEN